MPAHPAQHTPHARGHLLPGCWLPLTWLLLAALAFSINAVSFGTRAAADSGFIDQIEQLIFAGNGDHARLPMRLGNAPADADNDPQQEWQSHPPAPAFAALALAAEHDLTTPGANYARSPRHSPQAPRAPPLA